jgi:hypothetical protein
MNLFSRLAVLLLLVGVAVAGLSGCRKGTAVTEVEPNWGNVAGKDDAVIHGRGFKAGMTVHFGKTQVTNVVIDSPTQIRIKTPSGPEGLVDVIVTDENGRTFVIKDGYRYTSAVRK